MIRAGSSEQDHNQSKDDLKEHYLRWHALMWMFHREIMSSDAWIISHMMSLIYVRLNVPFGNSTLDI